MVESNSEVVTDPEGEKFCQILLGLLCDTKEIKIWDMKVEQKNSSRFTRISLFWYYF